MIKRLTSHRRVFEQILPVIVIVILGIFTYQVFFEIPFAGFEIENGRAKYCGLLAVVPGPRDHSVRDKCS